MKVLNCLLVLILLNQITFLKVEARPGETLDSILKKYNLEGQQPVTQGDYISYKANNTKFVSQPTVFFKLGTKGVVLEENFLFDKNTIHEKDVQRAKNDIQPTVAIPHSSYLVGDFSQLPREHFDTKGKAIGAAAAPFGAALGSFVGAGKGLYEGTKIGVSTANSASRALGGDVSGKAGAWASSATAVATGAITGLVAGLTGGAVEGSVRGARFALEGINGADREITGVTPVNSPYVIIGGRIGKELTPEEQRALLDQLSQLEQSRLAGGDMNNKDMNDKNLANLPIPTDRKELSSDNESLKAFDSAKDRSGFENNHNYSIEDSANKNVAGMW